MIIAVVTALATAVITRWLDDRRNEAAGEREVAAELRTHLAAAHRCATNCVHAFERAWALQPQRDGQVAETHDAFDETAFWFALHQLDENIIELRGQKSEVIVRSDPSVERGPANDIETMLVVATELSRWLRCQEVPADWGGDEQNFLLRSTPCIQP